MKGEHRIQEHGRRKNCSWEAGVESDRASDIGNESMKFTWYLGPGVEKVSLDRGTHVDPDDVFREGQRGVAAEQEGRPQGTREAGGSGNDWCQVTDAV